MSYVVRPVGQRPALDTQTKEKAAVTKEPVGSLPVKMGSNKVHEYEHTLHAAKTAHPVTLHAPSGEGRLDPFSNKEKVGLKFFALLKKLQPYERYG